MLTLPIKKKWFDMIATGQKKEEYRNRTKYYETRFINLVPINSTDSIPKYVIRYRAGYNPDSPLIECIISITEGIGRKEWGAEEGEIYYVQKIWDATVLKNKMPVF